MPDRPQTLSDAYAVLGLRVTAGPLELRGMDDATLFALADLAFDGVHEPDAMPFLSPWTLTPPESFHQSYLQYHWGVRAAFAPARWSLDLAVRYAGQLVGTQGVSTTDFLVTRSGETGSWLSRRFQGRGIGTLMRQTLCAFLFDHLDFAEITSGAFHDNAASNAVSRKVGYRPAGVVRLARSTGWGDGTELGLNQRYTLTADDLVRGPALQVEGVAGVRRLIGLDG